MILVNGCSFTTGEESPVAWPSLITGSINIATAGAANDYIVRTTVEYVNNNPVEQVIIAWTSPHRIEISGKQLTPTSSRKYGAVVDEVFKDWDYNWAWSKFITQINLLDRYLIDIPHVFVSAFEIQTWATPTDKIECYLGWPNEGLVEWIGDCPKGPGGHPLELGHQRIAEKINEHIRNLGWLS
jgi:hypothetical protein